MAISVVMPALEMAQETGKLVAWRKKEGDSVSKGEPLLEIETDKAVMEIESPGDGILAGIKAQAGAEVPVGRTIAWIVRPGEAPPSEIAPTESARSSTSELAHTVAAAPTPQESTGAGRKLSPKARRLAREHGIDITSLPGSGPDGAIVEKDVMAAVGVRRPGSLGSDLETLGPVARLMASRTSQSWTTIPHFFLVRDVDAGMLVKAKEKLAATIQQSRRVRLSVTDLLVALIGRVLPQHKRLNASWTELGIRLNPEVNVAIAMAVEDGVVAPVVHNADTIDLGEIAVQRHQLADRARSSKLRPADIAGATFTLSNLGMYNVDAFNAIITPPQTAILAVGRIADRVVPVNGAPGIQSMLTITLSCDHRAVAGAGAALFLQDLAEAIRQPEKWLR